ncbi:20S proteasome subunit [Enterocytozoon bieneusi H348]|nr:20S proteasome subunit [Enterocytozoon bieneusi H348]|eukprot:XP_002649450.1 20S proteasome subunit [Enterocytozoon bieneusi H348]
MFIHVHFKKNYYVPGECVEGEVQIQTRKSIIVDEFSIILEKCQIIKIQREEARDNIIDERTIIYTKKGILGKNLELAPGEHSFPFKFFLKYTDNASTCLKGYFGELFVLIQNDYKIIAIVDKMQSAITYLNVFQNPYDKKFMPINIIRKNMLFNIAKYRLLLELNQSTFLPGDVLKCRLKLLSKHHPKITHFSYRLIEYFVYKQMFLRSRVLLQSNQPVNENQDFSLCIRIPPTIGATCKELNFEIQTILDIELIMLNTKIKFKKYLNIKRIGNLLPITKEYYDFQVIEHPTMTLYL